MSSVLTNGIGNLKVSSVFLISNTVELNRKLICQLNEAAQSLILVCAFVIFTGVSC